MGKDFHGPEVSFKGMSATELQKLLLLTNRFVDEVNQQENFVVNDANRAGYIAQAKQEAAAFAAKINSRKQPHSQIGMSAEEISIKQSVIDWLGRTKRKLRGPSGK